MKVVSTLALLVAFVALAQGRGLLREDMSKVQFWLYTRSNDVNNGILINHDLSNLGSTAFDGSKRTYFLIHGWESGIHFAEDFVPDLLADSDCNVFGIDWSAIENINYVAAAQTCLEVGTYVGNFINSLGAEYGLRMSDVHAIGHSLGAEALGHLGRAVIDVNGPLNKVDRLSALDPAKPWFDSQDPSLRVGRDDGNWVDVLHTNSGDMTEGCLSFMDAMGHIDFYPNGGAHQPGCEDHSGDIADMIRGCSHGRAHEFYVESIRTSRNDFQAQECSSWDNYQNGLCLGEFQCFGHHCLGGSGSYYMGVNANEPYAQG